MPVSPGPLCVSTGTHSLRYHYLALSAPGPDLPQFLAVGYVDDHPFIQYDSHADRAEPQVPWMAPLDAQYLETETQKQRVWAKVQQVETWMVMGYHNHSSGALGGPPGPAPCPPACSCSRQLCLPGDRLPPGASQRVQGVLLTRGSNPTARQSALLLILASPSATRCKLAKLVLPHLPPSPNASYHTNPQAPTPSCLIGEGGQMNLN